MLSLYKISFVIFVSAVSSEGKIKNDEKSMPIEVVLNSKNDDKAPVPETTFLRNKAIELEIRSNDNKRGGKVDLIIQATKEIQAAEAKIDRYSPAFNSEFSLNNESPGDLKPGLKLNRNWDASRLDSHTHYPSHGTELFPLLMLRQILQTPHPLIGQNQLSPSQTLRHFEDNLHREIMPFHQRWEPTHKLPMHLVVSQPIFTRAVSPNLLNQQHVTQTPHLPNMFQNGLLQNLHAQNYNLPLNNYQTNILGNNLPVNRYSLNPVAPQNGYLSNNQNFPKNNDLLNISPLQHNSKSQNLHLSSKNNVPVLQTIRNILSNNNTPLPINNQPNYALERNPQNFNIPVEKHPQNISPYQVDQLPNIPKLHDHGSRNYQQNREAQLANYKQIITRQPNQNSNHNPLHRPLNHHQSYNQNALPGIHSTDSNTYSNNHRPLNHHQSYNRHSLPGIHSTDLNTYSNNQQYPNHQRSIPPIDHQNNVLGENYRPFLRESPLQSQSLANQNHHNLHHEHSSPHSSNDYRNHAFTNEPTHKTPDDDKRIPIYYRSPEGSRPLYYQHQSRESPDSQKYHTPTDQSYSRSSSLSSSSSPTQDHHYSEPETAHRNTYQEPAYGSPTRSSSVGIKDSLNQSDEIISPVRSKYDDDYISSKPLRKRKSRKKKIYEAKENIDDLDGHSSHQYIIKIG